MCHYILPFFILYSVNLAANNISAISLTHLTKIYFTALKQLALKESDPKNSINRILNLCDQGVTVTTFGEKILSRKRFKKYLYDKFSNEASSNLIITSPLKIKRGKPEMIQANYTVKSKNTRYKTSVALTWNDNKIVEIYETVFYPGF